VHSEQDAPVNRLQPIANVGQSAPDNHAHRVIEIRPAHLVFDVDGDYVPGAAVTAEGQ
jgi:hypothetical protein